MESVNLISSIRILSSSYDVQTKMESFCDIVKERYKQADVTSKNIQTVVKLVNEEEDRSTN